MNAFRKNRFIEVPLFHYLRLVTAPVTPAARRSRCGSFQSNPALHPQDLVADSRPKQQVMQIESSSSYPITRSRQNGCVGHRALGNATAVVLRQHRKCVGVSVRVRGAHATPATKRAHGCWRFGHALLEGNQGAARGDAITNA